MLHNRIVGRIGAALKAIDALLKLGDHRTSNRACPRVSFRIRPGRQAGRRPRWGSPCLGGRGRIPGAHRVPSEILAGERQASRWTGPAVCRRMEYPVRPSRRDNRRCDAWRLRSLVRRWPSRCPRSATRVQPPASVPAFLLATSGSRQVWTPRRAGALADNETADRNARSWDPLEGSEVVAVAVPSRDRRQRLARLTRRMRAAIRSQRCPARRARSICVASFSCWTRAGRMTSCSPRFYGETLSSSTDVYPTPRVRVARPDPRDRGVARIGSRRLSSIAVTSADGIQRRPARHRARRSIPMVLPPVPWIGRRIRGQASTSCRRPGFLPTMVGVRSRSTNPRRHRARAHGGWMRTRTVALVRTRPPGPARS